MMTVIVAVLVMILITENPERAMVSTSMVIASIVYVYTLALPTAQCHIASCLAKLRHVTLRSVVLCVICTSWVTVHCDVVYSTVDICIHADDVSEDEPEVVDSSGESK